MTPEDYFLAWMAGLYATLIFCFLEKQRIGIPRFMTPVSFFLMNMFWPVGMPWYVWKIAHHGR